MSLLRRIQASRAASKPSEPLPTDPKAKAAKIARMAAESRNREERFAQEFGHNAVRNSADLERILALPRRPIPSDEDFTRMRREMTARLTNGRKAGDGCRCHELNPAMYDGTPGSACITELRDIQAWYLYEAAEVQGALGPIAVGAGKTGIDILVAMVVPDCKHAVLLLPPTLKPQFLADFALWSQHFKVPNIAGAPMPDGGFITGRPVLHVLKYSELSSPNFATWFDARPEINVVIADEAQALKDRNATRVKRFIAHFLNRPETRFFCHTGSLTSKGIEDYSHLCVLALREGSPVPIEPHVVTAWGEALNPTRHGAEPAPPGALLRLCQPGEDVRRGYARRLIETKGVIATFEGSLTGVRLIVKRRKPPPMPPEVREALNVVRTKKLRPDKEELQDALEVARCAREVACGFYMYWNFPDASTEDFLEPDGRIPIWFRLRQAWNREVRNKLDGPHVPGMDSPGLLEAAAQRYAAGYKGDKPVWNSKTWAAWHAVEDTVPHESRTNWISDWLARDAAAWMHEQEQAGKPGIVWTSTPELGHLVAKLAKRPYYGRGDEAAIAIRAERGDRSLVASIPAHHKGRNLQPFNANLIMQMPSSAEVTEQLIGRTHRSLQKAPEVTVEVYLHVAEMESAFDVAFERANYAQGTTFNAQKLLDADSSEIVGGLQSAKK